MDLVGDQAVAHGVGYVKRQARLSKSVPDKDIPESLSKLSCFIKKEDLRRARSPSDASDITSHTTVSVFSRHSDNGDELSKVLCAAYNGGVSAARDARGKSLPATSFPDALTVAQPYSGKHDVGEAAMRRGVGYAIKEAQNQLVVTDTNNKLLSLVGATF